MKRQIDMPIEYGKNQAKIIGGVAILLMLFHHFFGFPSWLKPGIEFTSILPYIIEFDIAQFGKMCVAIYAFNSGYAMWSSQSSYTYAKMPVRIFKFLTQYWLVALLFILYAFVVGDKMPTLEQFAYNLFGFKTGSQSFVNVIIPWYVYFYIAILLLSPILIRLFKPEGFIRSCVVAFSLMIASWAAIKLNIESEIVGAIVGSLYGYLGSVLAGILVCKFNLFNVIDRAIGSRNVLLYIAVICSLVYARKYIYVPFLIFNTDVLWVVIFIYCVLATLRAVKSERVEQILQFLGTYSMNMWFVHAIFFAGTLDILQRVLYFPKYSILVYVWGVLLTLVVSMFCSVVYNKLSSGVSALMCRK
ncbi:MAG: acyltransferase family protein [Rikenellaceae bacterium]